MKIYIDSEYKCHPAPSDGLRGFEVADLDGKCDVYIEGCRYIPDGESWERSDGEVFEGAMFSMWKDSGELERAQLEYELEQANENLSELAGLYVEAE